MTAGLCQAPSIFVLRAVVSAGALPPQLAAVAISVFTEQSVSFLVSCQPRCRWSMCVPRRRNPRRVAWINAVLVHLAQAGITRMM